MFKKDDTTLFRCNNIRSMNKNFTFIFLQPYSLITPYHQSYCLCSHNRHIATNKVEKRARFLKYQSIQSGDTTWEISIVQCSKQSFVRHCHSIWVDPKIILRGERIRSWTHNPCRPSRKVLYLSLLLKKSKEDRVCMKEEGNFTILLLFTTM